MAAFLQGSLRWAVLVFALAATGLPASQSYAEESATPPLPGLSAVLPQLRAGGLVIYLRHAESAPGGSDEEAVMSRCETQRNLSAGGRKQAEQIGRAIAALKIRVGTVKASPFCRCKDTAALAFGHYEVDQALFFTLATNAQETKRLAESLRRMLGTAPARGTNTVIVAHSANLREAAGLWPKPEGAAYVFRPDGGDRFSPIARIAPEEWATVAHLN